MSIKGRIARIEKQINITASRAKVYFYDSRAEYEKDIQNGKIFNENDVVFIDDISSENQGR